MRLKALLLSFIAVCVLSAAAPAVAAACDTGAIRAGAQALKNTTLEQYPAPSMEAYTQGYSWMTQEIQAQCSYAYILEWQSWTLWWGFTHAGATVEEWYNALGEWMGT